MPSIIRTNCLVVGDPGVGKSQLCGAMQSDRSHFSEAYSMTTSIDICSRLISIPEQNVAVEVFLMDTSGRKLFFDLNQKQCSEASLLAFVFDVTSKESLSSLQAWSERLKHVNKRIPSIVVATKSDLALRRVVTSEEGRAVADKMAAHYVETSALAKNHSQKEKTNIKEVLQYLAQEHLMRNGAR